MPTTIADFNAPRYLRVCELDVYASLPGSGLTLAGSWGSESFLMSVNKPTATTPNALVDSLLVGQSNTTAKAMPGEHARQRAATVDH